MCERYGHLNLIVSESETLWSETIDLSSTAPLRAHDTDYYALAAGANMFWHCATPSDR